MPTSSSPPAHEALRGHASAVRLPAAEARGGASAEEVAAAAALDDLRIEWERLWRQVPGATPFQSPDWLLPWFKHVARGAPATIAVRSAADRELVALAPLYVHLDPATGRRHLFPIGIATTDYLDVLLKPHWEERALRCIMSHLGERTAHWDVLEFPQLRRAASLLGLVTPEGWRREIAPGEPNPVLALRGLRSDAGLPIPASMQQNIHYYRRRAARAGALAYQTADAHSLPAVLDALFRLHARRWTERGEPGVLNDESVRDWHREAAPLLHAAGLLRLHALRLDGEVIAVLYCLADAAPARERRHYYYLGGFDPRWRSLSPGTLLIAHAIERAVAEGATAFDFLRGAEAYKSHWGAVDQPMYTLRLWREQPCRQ